MLNIPYWILCELFSRWSGCEGGGGDSSCHRAIASVSRGRALYYAAINSCPARSRSKNRIIFLLLLLPPSPPPPLQPTHQEFWKESRRIDIKICNQSIKERNGTMRRWDDVSDSADSPLDAGSDQSARRMQHRLANSPPRPVPIGCQRGRKCRQRCRSNKYPNQFLVEKCYIYTSALKKRKNQNGRRDNWSVLSRRHLTWH